MSRPFAKFALVNKLRVHRHHCHNRWQSWTHYEFVLRSYLHAELYYSFDVSALVLVAESHMVEADSCAELYVFGLLLQVPPHRLGCLPFVPPPHEFDLPSTLEVYLVLHALKVCGRELCPQVPGVNSGLCDLENSSP